jgi:hypothetical protein
VLPLAGWLLLTKAAVAVLDDRQTQYALSIYVGWMIASINPAPSCHQNRRSIHL